MASDNIDERVQFSIQSNVTLHDDVRELFRTTETLAQSIRDLKVIAQQDGENIRALARIAEAHEHRLTNLEDGRRRSGGKVAGTASPADFRRNDSIIRMRERHLRDILMRVNRYCRVHHLAAVMLAAMACGFTGTLANAQSNDLIAAAGRGDLPAVNALLTAGADVNDDKNTVLGPTTALMEASSKGHLEVVQALLAAKADVNATRGHNSTDGDTALALASRNGHLNVVQALMAAKANVNAGSIPALYVAAMAGNLDIVRVLLAAKPNLDWRDPMYGTTALMQALAPFRLNSSKQLQPSSSRWDVARLLVEAGANVNVTTKAGVTALMLVAEESSPRSLAMVQALLAAHADISGGGTAGARPVSTISPISEGAQTYSYGRGGYTALGLAASAGSVEVVQALLDANAQRAALPSLAVNAKQPGGNTALTIASAKGRSDVVRLLLAAKADVSAADDDGKTALMLALENDHPEAAELLRSAAAALPEQK